MACNPAPPDSSTHLDKNETSSKPAVSGDIKRTKNSIEYEKLLKLTSQELPDADSNLLKNPIHPIFQKRNWEKAEQDSWPLLQPALRLASRFIGEDEMVAFWYHLVWGRRKMQDASEEIGQTLERFSADGPPLNAKQKRQISRWLRDFGDNQHYSFLSFQTEVQLGETLGTEAGIFAVMLNWELLELLRGHSLSETQLLRLNFLIAIMALHELAHAVWCSLRRSPYEPYYGDHPLAELGNAWGCWAFGGAINTGSMPTKEILGHSISWVSTPPLPWAKARLPKAWPTSLPPPPVFGDLPKTATSWILGTEYFQRVQTEEFWEKDIKAFGVKALHVPPTDGNRDSHLSSNTNWTASATVRRGPEDEMIIVSWYPRAGAESERYIEGRSLVNQTDRGRSLWQRVKKRVLSLRQSHKGASHKE